MIKTDFLIIGSGIAGLTYAIKTAKANPDKSVTIITKADKGESNTKYAQGGIAIVLDKEDSFEKHIEDTLRAGDFINDPEVVRRVVEEAPERLKELISWGTRFDKNEDGKYNLGKEGGHSASRVLHHKDITGFEMERALLEKVAESRNIKVLSHHYAIELITDHHMGKLVTRRTPNTCYGAYTLNHRTGEIDRVIAKITMLTSGGAGQVYSHTTNPIIATGDGIAMAYRAKAIVSDMEFIQFHPTSLFELGKSPSFLISEAVRGFGAFIRNKKGERFVLKTDARGELASRDIVSKAIDKELKVTGVNCVYLDCTHLEMKPFYKHFPNITDYCKKIGIDVSKDWIPIVPAAHYTCGGINVDLNGETTITNLYAGGECARTGLHGANRLASNSLLEALVYAHHAAEDVTKKINKIAFNEHIPVWNAEGTTDPDELILITHSRKELQTIMSDYVAIVRSNIRLRRALSRLKIHHEETEELYKTTKISPQLCELRNLITVAYLIVTQSMVRSENKGAFYNVDLV
jgi:L-aspartate oxidase